jgi:uncharacterized protein
MHHKMKIFGFTLDTLAQRPVVILKDAEDNNTIPIWIGSMEAVSMAAQLISGDIMSQSGREDLFSKLMEKMEMKVANVSIDSLNDGVFTSTVTLSSETGEIRIDVRPYEAIAISLKYDLPIMVSDEVMARGSVLAMNDESIARENDARRFIDFLENLEPSDLGKYPM